MLPLALALPPKKPAERPPDKASTMTMRKRASDGGDLPCTLRRISAMKNSSVKPPNRAPSLTENASGFCASCFGWPHWGFGNTRQVIHFPAIRRRSALKRLDHLLGQEVSQ